MLIILTENQNALGPHLIYFLGTGSLRPKFVDLYHNTIIIPPPTVGPHRLYRPTPHPVYHRQPHRSEMPDQMLEVTRYHQNRKYQMRCGRGS